MAKSVPYSDRKFDAKKKQNYDNEYMKDKYDRIVILSVKGTKDKLKQIAADNGQSVNEILNHLIDDYLNK